MYLEIIGDLSPIIKYLRRFCTFQGFYNKYIVYKSLKVLINPTTLTYITGKQK